MESNFFQRLAGLSLRGNVNINVRVGDGEKMQVSVLLSNPSLKDKAASGISPMLLEGTPVEMDNGFYDALSTPLLKTNAFFVNAVQHQQSLSNSMKNSSMEKSKHPSANPSQKRKYDAKLEKVAELEKKNKIGEAIAQMPSAKDFPEYEKQITAKLSELKAKHGSFSLFQNEDSGNEGDEQVAGTERDDDDDPGEEDEPDTEDELDGDETEN